MKVVLLASRPAPGAGPDDLDTLAQAAALGQALAALGHAPARADFSLDLPATARALAAAAPGAVVNLVESVDGNARLIHLAPALLEDLGLAYTGGDQAAVLLSNHKVLGKRLLAPHGIPTPAWTDRTALLRGAPLPGGPLIVKSVTEHASTGLDDDSVLTPAGPADLLAALDRAAARHGGEWFAEAYAPGREFNVALLDGPDGPQVLPVAEMLFTNFAPDRPRIVGYDAKWDETSDDYAGTVRSFEFPEADRGLLDALADLSRRTWAAFGLSGYARVDFRADGQGRPLVIDVNANPCLSPDAGFAAALRQAGISYTAAVARILDAALARVPPPRPRSAGA
ncbi:MAG: D-alanine--D-alanine ligase [Thermodesulfobacteriota bacterium]